MTISITSSTLHHKTNKDKYSTAISKQNMTNVVYVLIQVWLLVSKLELRHITLIKELIIYNYKNVTSPELEIEA